MPIPTLPSASGRTRSPAATMAVLGVAAAAVLSAAAPAGAATGRTSTAVPHDPPGHGARTAVTFDPSVVRNLTRLGVRIRPVDAEERGRGDDVTIVFRVVPGSGRNTIEHRGGIMLDTSRRQDLLLDRPTFDLRRGTVSVSIGRGERVTLLTAERILTVRPGAPEGRPQGPGGQQGPAGQQGRPNDHQNGRPGTQQGGTQQGGTQQGGTQQGGIRPRAGGGTGGFAPSDNYPSTLRLTSQGAQLLDRTLRTTWFWSGQRIGTAEFAEH